MKSAFLFPGQGAQKVGMGKDFVESFDEADKLFARADEILGYDLKRICFEGPEEKLNSTTFSQPAIFVTSAAILEVLRNNPQTSVIKADVTAGLSLGEYSALYAAGVIGFEDCLKLVQKRGQAMQEASDTGDGGMVSIIGLDKPKVLDLCDKARGADKLEAVNFNCPGQIVVSGSKEACDRAERLGEEYGAIKAVRLSVAGAFHTEMMASAADALEEALLDADISSPSDTAVMANVDADYYRSAEEIREGLVKQLTQPLLWQESMERLLAEGVEKFYEIGPGRVLTGLMRRINRKTKVINISSKGAFEKLYS